MNDTERLLHLLESMDVPAMRREFKPENLRWLSRNLAVNSSSHPNFDEAAKLVSRLSRS